MSEHVSTASDAPLRERRRERAAAFNASLRANGGPGGYVDGREST